MLNTFAGGAMERCAIGTLGIMPYISATIIIQLLTAVWPKLSKLAREEGGRSKIIQYGRYLTVLLCLGQGLFYAIGWENPGKIVSGISRLACSRRKSHLVVSHPDGVDHDDGHDAAHVAGRTDHRTRHWQRHFAGHHRRHSGAAAAGGVWSSRHVFPGGRWREPHKFWHLHRHGVAAGGRGGGRHRGDAGAAENSRAIRAARRWPENVSRAEPRSCRSRSITRASCRSFSRSPS